MKNHAIGLRNKNTNLSKAPYLMDTLSKMIMLLVDVKLSDNAEKAARMSALLQEAVEQLPELEKRVIKMAYMLEKIIMTPMKAWQMNAAYLKKKFGQRIQTF